MDALMGDLAQLERLELVSKVASELQNHLELGEPFYLLSTTNQHRKLFC